MTDSSLSDFGSELTGDGSPNVATFKVHLEDLSIQDDQLKDKEVDIGIHNQNDEKAPRSRQSSSSSTRRMNRVPTSNSPSARKVASSVKSRKKSSSESPKKLAVNEDDEQQVQHLRSRSRERRVQNKFSHAVYENAAQIYDHLKTSSKELPVFENDFEKRRSYSLAFSAKRYEAVLKDVLLDSSFYSSYFKLETFHHAKVMVMLLDFYEHNFRFSDSKRQKLTEDTETYKQHINDIQNAFLAHKIKLCSAFARNRIKACALSLEGLLPTEVKERGECGARHPLYVRVNRLLSNKEKIIKTLQEEGFTLTEDLDALSLMNWVFRVDEQFTDLLVFSKDCKDDVYNNMMAIDYHLIPQSKPRYLLFEVVRSILEELAYKQHMAASLIDGDTDFFTEGEDVLLTHPEFGSLSAHLASCIHKDKRIHICGAGKNEFEIRQRLKAMGASNFELIHHKFTEVTRDDERVKRCKLIICNPPCSKSGVASPVDFVLQEGPQSSTLLSSTVTPKEMQRIADHETETLRHAMKFSSCQYIVYTTQSVQEDENEKLVQKLVAEPSSPYQLSSFLHDLVHSLTSSIEVQYCDSEKEDYLQGGLQLPISSYMDGFFVALLKRRVKEETVREIMDRAQKTGLYVSKKAIKNPKKASKRKNKKKKSDKKVAVNPDTAIPSSEKPFAKNQLPEKVM